MSKIYIGAGHGGTDSGAVSGKHLEKTYNLAIANKVTALLRQAGHIVLQNRTTDVFSHINDKAKQSNDWGADLTVDIHLNAGGGTGSEVFYKVAGGKSKQAAEIISKNISNVFDWRNRGAKTKTYVDGGKTLDWFGMVRLPKSPAILIEVCFIDSTSDMAKFDIDKSAKAIVDGILAVYPAPKLATPPTSNTTINKYSIVKVKTTAKNYGGQSKNMAIPDFVKKATYTIKQISNTEALLSEINSWIKISDLEAVSAPSKTKQVIITATKTVGETASVTLAESLKKQGYAVSVRTI